MTPKEIEVTRVIVILLAIAISFLMCSCQFDFVDEDEEACRIHNEWIDEQIRIEEAKCDGWDKCTPDNKKIYKLNQQRCEL